MFKPIIGIVTKHYLKDDIRPDMYIRDELKQAIFDNNAVAIGILLPKNEKLNTGDNWNNNLSHNEYESLISQINLCNGIIFQGGGACDSYEMIIARYCYDNNIPTLGICCGQNVLVRALGGTTTRIDNPDDHKQKDKEYVHKIRINKNSKLYDIIKEDEIMVNSRHSKITKKHPELLVAAVSEENYPEAIESKNKKFYIAVQFHPESLYKKDENMNNIFKAFIEACINRGK